MSRFRLTSRQRRDLEEQLTRTPDARVYRRTLALLQLDRGKGLFEVAQELGVSRQSVYNWKRSYEQGAKEAGVLSDAARSGRPSVWTEERERLLRSALESSPQRWGYQATGWTVGLLQRYLSEHSGQALSQDSIRRHLHALGYTWKRFRYVLKADPEREKKAYYPA